MTQYYPLSTNRRPMASLPATPVEMGKIGAVVGLCGAGAANLRRLRKHEMSGGEALVDTLRSGVASGLATATATLVASRFRQAPFSLLATLVTGTAVMYALNAENRKSPTGEEV